MPSTHSRARPDPWDAEPILGTNSRPGALGRSRRAQRGRTALGARELRAREAVPLVQREHEARAAVGGAREHLVPDANVPLLDDRLQQHRGVVRERRAQQPERAALLGGKVAHRADRLARLGRVPEGHRRLHLDHELRVADEPVERAAPPLLHVEPHRGHQPVAHLGRRAAALAHRREGALHGHSDSEQ